MTIRHIAFQSPVIQCHCWNISTNFAARTEESATEELTLANTDTNTISQVLSHFHGNHYHHHKNLHCLLTFILGCGWSVKNFFCCTGWAGWWYQPGWPGLIYFHKRLRHYIHDWNHPKTSTSCSGWWWTCCWPWSEPTVSSRRGLQRQYTYIWVISSETYLTRIQRGYMTSAPTTLPGTSVNKKSEAQTKGFSI